MSSGNFQHSFRRPDAPRRAHDGQRLRRRGGLDQLQWPARQWFETVVLGIGDNAIHEGLEYAIGGQVTRFAVLPGECAAMVQGRAARPYATAIRFSRWSTQDWDRALAAMASEAVYSARLMTGELPSTAERLFANLGLPFLEEPPTERTCTCSEPAPCKHIYALAALAAERIEQDPLALLALRGMAPQPLLERLQEARALATRGASQAHAHPAIATSAPPLPPIEDCLHDFWRPGAALHDAETAPPEAHVPHALLRRLGQPQLGGRFPMMGLLASAYDTIRAAAIRLDEQISARTTGPAVNSAAPECASTEALPPK